MLDLPAGCEVEEQVAPGSWTESIKKTTENNQVLQVNHFILGQVGCLSVGSTEYYSNH